MSGVPKTGEGADFRLEEVNKRVQQWIPNILSPKDWQIACCNFDKLSELRNIVFQQMNISDPKQRSTKVPQNIDDEVVAFRAKLRSVHYLEHPYEKMSSPVT